MTTRASGINSLVVYSVVYIDIGIKGGGKEEWKDGTDDNHNNK